MVYQITDKCDACGDCMAECPVECISEGTPRYVINADECQLEQVLMNLAANARDAMPTGGTLTIESRLVHYGKDDVGQILGMGEGKYALLAFSDTGTGMDEEVQKRIFEPFFTTKERGRGTGLGLAICYSIVRQHGGFIDLTSKEGQGTTFRIYLPLVHETPGMQEQSGQ